MTSASGDLGIGDIIGERYRVEQIHPGGMGIVYRVRETGTGEIFAIKTLKSPTTVGLRERFETEALNWIATPRHDNVVRAYQVIIEDRRPFLILEYIAGGSVAERLRAGPLTRDTAIDWACQLCLGMAALSRSRELAHLDLKPANLLLSPDEVLKISDFGLVKVTTPFSSRPAHERMGTFRYASPEQFLDEVVDTRSDIFSFGVLFFELLTGSSPYPVLLTSDSRRDSFTLHHLHIVFRREEALTSKCAAELGADESYLRALLKLDDWDGNLNPLGLLASRKLGEDVGAVVKGCLGEHPWSRWRNFEDLGRQLARIAPKRFRRQLEKLSEVGPAPRDPIQSFLLAVSCQNLGRHEQALDQFNHFLGQAPNPAEEFKAQAYFRAALSYEALGDTERALWCWGLGERAGVPVSGIMRKGKDGHAMDRRYVPPGRRGSGSQEVPFGTEVTDDCT
jgi:serine/threonine protein kinase